MIKKCFDDILEYYLIERNKSLTDNYLAKLIRTTTPFEILNGASISPQYFIKGSVGQGQWARIPWIAIFDKEITRGATQGFYIVYLFDEKMEGVYLSLNQGWTQYEHKYGVKTGKQEIKNNTEHLKNLLRSSLDDFSFSSITLHASGMLGEGYELGHVCGLYYQKNHIPEDPILINDLRNLIGVYREIKGLIGNDILNIKYAYELNEEDDDEATPQDKIEINSKVAEAITTEEIDHLLSIFEEKIRNMKDQKQRRRIASAIARNNRVGRLIKQRAGYYCVVCGILGFKKSNSERYAEVHHIEELGKSGLDAPSNLCCVCPTCHRAIHYGSAISLEERKRLKTTTTAI